MTDWIEKELGEILVLNYGWSLPDKKRSAGDYPVYGSNGIVGYHNEALVNSPGLVVGRKGSAGNVNYSRMPFCPIDTTFFITPEDTDLDIEFLYFLLLHLDLKRILGDVGVPGLNRQVAYRERAKYPFEIFEQRQIAHVLSMVQTAIEQQERLISLIRELKAALMHKLFTEGLRGEKQKETEIGLVPESWEVVTFSDFIDIKSGQADPKSEPFSNMIHVGPENIERDTGRLIDLKTNSELGIKSGNYHFTPNDVLYSKIRPYLNKVAIPDFEGTCSADMYPLTPQKGGFQREFMFQLLLSEVFKNQAVSHQDRTGIPKINRNQLGSILIPKPSFGEQQEIAEYLGIIDTKLTFVKHKSELFEALFRSLLHQLMTGAIRVNDIELEGLN